MNPREGHATPPADRRDETFVRRLLIILAIGLLGLVIYLLSDVLLLFFGSILVAVILRSIANPLMERTGLSERMSLGIAGLLIVGTLGLSFWWLGPGLAAELSTVLKNLPAAASKIAERYDVGPLSEFMQTTNPATIFGNVVSRAVSWGSSILGALAALLLVIFGGIYLAAEPKLYRDGIVKLVPPRLQANVDATLDDCSNALPRWVGAQLFAMVLVGSLTGLGLWLVGVPSALALGFISGIAEFVPYVGPLAAAIPALLLASTQDSSTVVWTLVVLVVVQQLESNVIVPMVANKAVSVQPAVGLYAVVALGILFGPLGLLFGFPLAIVTDIAIRRLYVLDTLDEPVEILGEPAKPSEDVATEHVEEIVEKT